MCMTAATLAGTAAAGPTEGSCQSGGAASAEQPAAPSAGVRGVCNAAWSGLVYYWTPQRRLMRLSLASLAVEEVYRKEDPRAPLPNASVSPNQRYVIGLARRLRGPGAPTFQNFEGWRYVRFPLPGNHPFDASRDLETTWWGSRGGDGIVDLPLVLEKIIVEARSKIRMPLPAWAGPMENPITRLVLEGVVAAPEIKAVVEPEYFNDGRRMVVRFEARDGFAYNLYLSRTKDGRGADLLKSGVKDGDTVTGFRPEIPVFLFLTAVDQQKQESKPSAAFSLTTHDNFLEK